MGLGVADINGATTATIKEVFEGGGTLTPSRTAASAGAVRPCTHRRGGGRRCDDPLPVPSSGCVGMLDIATLIEGGKVAIQNDGTCTVLSGSTNLVATDTDAKLAVFNDSATPRSRTASAARAACSPPTLGRSLTPYLSRYGSPHSRTAHFSALAAILLPLNS